MNEEEIVDRTTAFWTVRNKILEDMRKAFPEGWLRESAYCMELSLLAAEGVCAREANKVAAGLNNTLNEIQAASKKLEEQIERLNSNNIFAQGDGIDWDLLKDYFKGGKENDE
tara:strand:+ start:369 stop:707 length:339 start_codon:yes stop_codon:yes gene_type:complete